VYVPPTAAAGTATAIVGSHEAVLFPLPVPVTTVCGVPDSVMVDSVVVTVPVVVTAPGV
jgi:hypothetical protein